MPAESDKPSIIRRIPVLRILLPFVSGIIAGILFDIPMIFPCLTFFAGLIVMTIFSSLKSKSKWKWRFVPGLIITCVFFCFGYMLVILKTESIRPEHFSKSKSDYFIGIIDDDLAERSKSYKTFLKVKFQLEEGKWKKSEGRLLMYFEKNDATLKLQYGDKIILKLNPVPIAAPSNPGEFDYKQFLEFKQVYAQAYVKNKNYHLISNGNGNSFIAQSIEWRHAIIKMLQKGIKNERECAVAVALLVGDDDAIDPELMQAYSSSGTLHVLSVSGMHVGVIYLILAFAFGFLERNKYLKHVYYPWIIILVWSYAMLSGFSSSVLRSAMMLSLVIVGKWINSKSPVLNTLSVSLFVLLCWNPFMIVEAGFQLSYLAVFGIVYLHPKLLPKAEMPNNFLHKAWELTSVSICAQLTTTPISLFYFHQYPNLFILSNLLVIPLTTLAIYLTVSATIFSSVPYAGVWIAFADTEIIAFVNRVVLFMEKIPGSVTSGISISVFECILLYLFFGCLIAYLMQRKASQLSATMLISIILSISQLTELVQQREQEQLVEYKIPKQKAFGILKGRQHILLADSAFVNNKNLQKRYLQNFWFERGVECKEEIILRKE